MRPSAKLLTVREAAARLGLKESTIRKRILQRQIAYVHSRSSNVFREQGRRYKSRGTLPRRPLFHHALAGCTAK